MRALWHAAGILSLMFLQGGVSPSLIGTARAGELEGGIGGCDLSSLIGSCTWKPSSCHQPIPPSSFVVDRNSFNMAVDEFNDYVEQVNAYKQCMINEAKSDISKVPDIIVQSVQDASRKVDSDVQDARSSLEMQRPR